jgi:hypothetical protein
VIVTETELTENILPPGEGRHRRRWIGVVVVAALLAAGTGAYFAVHHDAGQTFPKTWDPRVADVAAFVAKERGLTFEHPVEVDFLSADAFEKLVRRDQSSLTADDKAQIEDSASFLRALGLIGTDVDLFAAVNDLNGDGTLAFYDDETKTVKVRGTTMTPALRSTLAHELTHTLQDQHFDLGRIDKLQGSASDALRGLAEGDANRVQHAYEASLDDADQQAIAAADSSDVQSFDESRFPAVLAASFSAPYSLGEPLAAMIVAVKGQKGLDAAFQHPPTSDLALFDPLRYLDGDKPLKVPALVAGKGEEKVDDGEFGAFSLYLVLAQRLDQKRALSVAAGWGGDDYLQYRADGHTCVRATFDGRDAPSIAALQSGLADWARSMPAGTATVHDVDGGASLQSCDLGAPVTVPKDLTVDKLLGLPTARVQIAQEVLQQGGDVRAARCFSDGVVNLLSVDQITASELDAATTDRIQAVAKSCRVS